MKLIVTILFVFFSAYLSIAQVKVGDKGVGFYHAEFDPPYLLQDSILDNYGETLNLDLNGDGINDIMLKAIYGWAAGEHGTSYQYKQSYFIRTEFTDIIISNEFADTLRLYDTLNNPHNIWSTYYPNSFNGTMLSTIPPIDSTWVHRYNKYVGFRIRQSVDTVYGWISINVTDYAKIIVNEFACQSNNTMDTLIHINVKENLIDPICIYPNPFDNHIYINTELPIEKVEFFSVEGQLLSTILSQDKILSTSNLKNGLYIIVVSLADNLKLRKLLLKTANP